MVLAPREIYNLIEMRVKKGTTYYICYNTPVKGQQGDSGTAWMVQLWKAKEVGKVSRRDHAPADSWKI